MTSPARFSPAVAQSRVFSLSVHAKYACGRSGACCTAGWHIPVEARLQRLLGARVLLPDASGMCPQLDARTGLCAVHRDHGSQMLPAACFQFPRRALIDERGTFITLSHYCPTAARLLFLDDAPLTIVERPEAFPAARAYEGLDARGAWAPLVRPDLLFDLDSYTRWERFVVSWLASPARTVSDCLSHIAEAAEDLRRWTPRQGLFGAWAAAVLDRHSPQGPARLDHASAPNGTTAAAGRYSAYTKLGAFHRVTSTIGTGQRVPACPDDLESAHARIVQPSWDRFSDTIRRYLAAKAFGSWSAYQSRGVRSLVAELYASEMVLRVETVRACRADGRALDRERLLAAIRQSDLLLIHLADRDALMKWIGRVEETCHPARARRGQAV